jgi:hypothetical protein
MDASHGKYVISQMLIKGLLGKFVDISANFVDENT